MKSCSYEAIYIVTYIPQHHNDDNVIVAVPNDHHFNFSKNCKVAKL